MPLHRPSRLVLENGTIFEGFSPSHQDSAYYGEVVFSTGMAGYPESLTDPSYAGQILLFTYPLIGNYGVPDKSLWESEKIHAVGVAVSEVCTDWSHHAGVLSFYEWLKEQNVSLITGVDTRAITKEIRKKGAMPAVIDCQNSEHHTFSDPNKTHLVSSVSVKEPITHSEGEKTIIVVDCGIKKQIIRHLKKRPLTIKQVPYDYDYTNEPFDGIVLSNGPGDPEKCPETVAILKKALEQNKPVFGICLGTQMLALATGAKTFKLPFGHRGHNQPCKETDTGKCYITSQNHGYAIDETTLPKEWSVTFRNLNDQTIEGISHNEKPFFAVQFHPEAAPGPTDTEWLFEKFYQLL